MSIMERLHCDSPECEYPSVEVLICDACEEEIDARSNRNDGWFERSIKDAAARMAAMQASVIAQYFDIKDYTHICEECAAAIKGEYEAGETAEREAKRG